MSPEFTTDLRPLLNKLLAELDRLSEELRENKTLSENEGEQSQSPHLEHDEKL